MVQIGEAIKHIRQVNMLSQEAFAKAIGVSFTTVNRWESGKTKPSYKAANRIAVFCKERASELDFIKIYLEDKDVTESN